MERNEAFASLEAVLAHAWALLQQGARDADSGMSRPVLATRGLDDLPNARTVLLWRADTGHRTLYFHTDVRSPKHLELQRTPWALLVFYDAAVETQLRIHARVKSRYDDELTRAAWAGLPPETRRVFATAQPPGHAASGPVAAPAQLDAAALQAAYRNFELLEARIVHLDWLHFTRAGHRRAAFTWTDGAEPKMTWLYP